MSKNRELAKSYRNIKQWRHQSERYPAPPPVHDGPFHFLVGDGKKPVRYALYGAASAFVIGLASIVSYNALSASRAERAADTCAPFETDTKAPKDKPDTIPLVSAGISLPSANAPTDAAQAIVGAFQYKIHTDTTTQTQGRGCYMVVPVELEVNEAEYNKTTFATSTPADDFDLEMFAQFLSRQDNVTACQTVYETMTNAVQANATVFQNKYFPAEYLANDDVPHVRTDYYPYQPLHDSGEQPPSLPGGEYRLIAFGNGSGGVLNCWDPTKG